MHAVLNSELEQDPGMASSAGASDGRLSRSAIDGLQSTLLAYLRVTIKYGY